MKNSRLAPLFLAFLLAGFVAFVAHSSKQLPDRVATHFNLHGKPDGWMSRAQHVKFTVGIGVGTPVLVLGVFALVGKMKGWGVNIPNKAYWLAPERAQATFTFLQNHSFWLAGLIVAFHAGLFQSVLLANTQHPAHLSFNHMIWLTSGFLLLLTVWIVTLFRRFRLPAA